MTNLEKRSERDYKEKWRERGYEKQFLKEGTKNKHAGAEGAKESRENIRKHFLFLFSQKASGIWFGLTKHPLPKVGNRSIIGLQEFLSSDST